MAAGLLKEREDLLKGSTGRRTPKLLEKLGLRPSFMQLNLESPADRLVSANERTTPTGRLSVFCLSASSHPIASSSSSSSYSLFLSVYVSVCGVVWCGVVWCGVVWCGVVWCGVVWCGVVWCGVVWCGVVWCGVVWCGVV